MVIPVCGKATWEELKFVLCYFFTLSVGPVPRVEPAISQASALPNEQILQRSLLRIQVNFWKSIVNTYACRCDFYPGAYYLFSFLDVKELQQVLFGNFLATLGFGATLIFGAT